MSDLKEKHPTIHLHIYKIKKGISGVAKGEDGKIINDNHRVSLPYDTMEWNNWLKQIIPSGIIKIDVLGFAKIKYDSNGHYESHSYVDVSDDIKKKISDSLVAKVNIKLTPEQKKIAELEAKLDAVLAGNKIVKEDAENNIASVLENAESIDKLKSLRSQYTLLNNGKKGSPKWDVETLKIKINELDA